MMQGGALEVRCIGTDQLQVVLEMQHTPNSQLAKARFAKAKDSISGDAEAACL
jgi:hypothetical protein